MRLRQTNPPLTCDNSKWKSMNGSLCYTRGTRLILGAEKGREKGVWNMFSITVNFSLQ